MILPHISLKMSILLNHFSHKIYDNKGYINFAYMSASFVSYSNSNNFFNNKSFFIKFNISRSVPLINFVLGSFLNCLNIDTILRYSFFVLYPSPFIFSIPYFF